MNKPLLTNYADLYAGWYWLDEAHQPHPVTTQEERRRAYGQKRVAETTLDDGRWVSTVFLSLDHGFGNELVLFETMVFQSKDEKHVLGCERWTSWDEAVAGHEAVVEREGARATAQEGRGPGR